VAVPEHGSVVISTQNVENVNQIDGIVTRELVTSADDGVLPEDALSEMGDQTLVLDKQRSVTPISVASPAGRTRIDRRQRIQLNQQIEILFRRVPRELNDNPRDVAFALDQLRFAQDIVLNDVERYEDALYAVFIVNQMLVKKYNLRRWSYSWGIIAFFYAVLWLGALFATVFLRADNLAGATTIWIPVLAGATGGVAAILWDLSWHVSVRKDFDRQYMMKYLVSPVMGLVLGGVVYLFTSAGLFALNLVWGGGGVTLSGGVLTIQVLFGFAAGFRQQVVYELVNVLMQRILISRNAQTD
jgi:hypothetical protein